MLTTFEKMGLNALSPHGAPMIIRLDQVMDDPKTDPALRAKLKEFSTQLQKPENRHLLTELSDSIKKDPAFEKKVEALALKNPDILLSAIPDAARRPGYMQSVVNGAQGKPAVAPAAPAAGSGAKPQSAPATAQPPAQPSPPPAPVTAVAGLTTDQKLQTLYDQGGTKFLAEVEKASPDAHKTITQMLSGKGPDGKPMDPAARETLVNGLYERARDNPKFFDEMTGYVQSNKGAASTLFSNLAANPGAGLTQLDQTLQAGRSPAGGTALAGGGIMGLLANLFKPGGFQALFAEVKQMFTEIKTMVAGLFGGSRDIQTDNPSLALRAKGATGSDATIRDIESGDEVRIAGMERDRQRSAAGPAIPGSDPAMRPAVS